MSELKYTALSRDVRPVRSIVLDGERHQVGEHGVTRISPFDETGEMAYVPWFEVWKGDRLYCRTNAAFIAEVYYEEGHDNEPEYEDLAF